MAKPKKHFVCNACGAISYRWAGKCESCNAWNTIEEHKNTAVSLNSSGAKRKGGTPLDFKSLASTETQHPRFFSHINEFDRVCGGGLVHGMVALIGGDPGIGKSTLLLQVAGALSKTVPTAYVSGEESLNQIRLRANRLGVENTPVHMATSTNMNDILSTMESPNAPKVIIVDSIQTMYLDAIESAPGTVSQVRACAGELVRVAKSKGICVFIVGHVTKDGAIAGPRVLEHMVDTVLYFEGERTHQYRILRSVKNRFGATDEIGVFDMTASGLMEVADPSAIFLSNMNDTVSGSAVFAGVEGTRPMLVEIQALVSPTAYATPKRSVVGWDSNRLAMILAVLDTCAGMTLSGYDVYLNVAGGLKISEPACDMACAAAVISALAQKPLPTGSVFFGEIGLTGDIRSVNQTDTRIKEAEKLGFQSCTCPKNHTKKPHKASIAINTIDTIANLYKTILNT